MSVHVRTPAVSISASTTSANAQITNTSCKFLRVVNGSATALCYINAGTTNGVTATAFNIALAPFEARNFERDPNNDTWVAVLLSSGTASVSVAAVNEDNL